MWSDLTNEEALPVLYSVIKMKRTSRFLINILLLTEQSTVMIKNLLNSPGIVLYFSKQTIGRRRYRLSSVFYTLIKHAFSNNQSARNVGMSENKCIMPSSRKSHRDNRERASFKL